MSKTSFNKGITLIVLVITIIVLLILAGVSIATLTGEGGILSKAQTAKKQTEIEEAKEQAKLDIADWTADKLQKGESATLSDSIVQEILTGKEYVKDETGQPGKTSFKTKKGGHEIPYSELYTNTTSGKVSFTLTPEDPVCGGSFEVDKGTTWAMFLTSKFHGLSGNQWGSFNKEFEEGKWKGGEVVVKVTDDPKWFILEDKDGNWVGKYAEILSR